MSEDLPCACYYWKCSHWHDDTEICDVNDNFCWDNRSKKSDSTFIEPKKGNKKKKIIKALKKGLNKLRDYYNGLESMWD